MGMMDDGQGVNVIWMLHQEFVCVCVCARAVGVCLCVCVCVQACMRSQICVL